MNRIFQGDCIEGMRTLPDQSVNCCVTSPPYFGLRDYGHKGQIGLEETPDQFVAKLVEVFREVKRVLKDDGTLWLNLGDSYAGGGGASGHTVETKNLGANTSNYGAVKSGGKRYGLKQKDLIGIPWMVAFALRADGWYLRQDIIWHKPNPMPESVTDRCTKSHEYIFLLSKSQKYWYDHEAIKTPIQDESIKRLMQDIENQTGSDRVPGKSNGKMKAVIGDRKYVDQSVIGKKLSSHTGGVYEDGSIVGNGMANKKSVWTVTTKPYSEAHFATYPPDLIVDCIKAGCPEGGIVLDPFMGAGTTAMVARKLNRNYVGFELNPEYIRIAQNRLQTELGMFV